MFFLHLAMIKLATPLDVIHPQQLASLVSCVTDTVRILNVEGRVGNQILQSLENTKIIIFSFFVIDFQS